MEDTPIHGRIGDEMPPKIGLTGGALIGLGVIALIGALGSMGNNVSDSASTAPSGSVVSATSGNAASNEDQSTDDSAQKQKPDDPAKDKKLKEQILALDHKGQKILKRAVPILEQIADSGSDEAQEKLQAVVIACQGVSQELSDVSSAHMGEVSIMDTVPGEDKPKTTERKYAEAASQLSMAYDFSAKSFNKLLDFTDDPSNAKRLREAREALNTANGMREQGQAELESAD